MSWYGSIKNSWLFTVFSSSNTKVLSQEENHVPGHQFTTALQPWESYMITAQSLLIWEKPYKSIIAVAFANVIFWSVVFSQPNVYFVTSCFAIAFFLYHQWVYCIWPEIRIPLPRGQKRKDYTDEWLHLSPSVMQAPEVGILLDDCCKHLKSFLTSALRCRRHKPLLFCLMSSSMFSLLLMVGQMFSGTALLYSALMSVLLLPGLYLHATPFVQQHLSKFAAFCVVQTGALFNRLAAKIAPVINHYTGTSETEDNTPDELIDFLPDSLSEEADAALSVPLLESDPPEVVAALQQKINGSELAESNSLALSGQFALTREASSPFSSLIPLLPRSSDVPGVSDSSDEEQEFIQGLTFDSYSKHNSGQLDQTMSAVSSPDESVDDLDLTRINYSNQINTTSAAVAMQTLANSFLQSSHVNSASAGPSLFSTIGQSVLSTVMANLSQSVAESPPAHRTARCREENEFSEEEDMLHSSIPYRGQIRSTAAERKTTRGMKAVRASGCSSLLRRRRVPVRRSNKRVSVARPEFEDVSSSSAVEETNDDDFEIISDEEYSDDCDDH